MSYRIDPWRDLGDEVRRIARSQLERAGEWLDGGDGDENEAIHEARKRFKKVRGLYRLVRNGAPGFLCAGKRTGAGACPVPVGRPGRDGAGRDRRRTCAAISLRKLRRRPVGSSRQGLVARRDRIVEKQADLRLRMRRQRAPARRPCRRSAGCASMRQQEGKGRRSSLPDGAGSACKGGRALKAAARPATRPPSTICASASSITGCMSASSSRAWPEPMRLRRREAKQIGDVVGDEHNLSLLAAAGRRRARGGRRPRPTRVADASRSADRQAALRAEALRRAGALFRDKPKREPERLALLWRQAS